MLNNDQLALLELLKVSLFGAKPDFPEDVDWDGVLTEATDQAVAALAAPAVPAGHSAAWQEPSGRSLVHFVRCMHEQDNLIRLFSERGVPPVILKGACAAMYYPAPSRRTMGDIDFIVPKNRFEEARGILEQNGYIFEVDYEDDRDYSYTKNGMVIELHHRYSDKDWDIEPLIDEGIMNAELHSINGMEFPALPTYINGLVLLDHVRHHLYGGLGIRQVIDWMMFVHSELDDESWENEFLPLARSSGLETFAVILTAMCREWFGLPDSISWCDNADMTAAEQLLERVFTSGNFGRKDPYEYRPMENFTMDVRKRGLFTALQSAGELNWEACRRHEALRPFAWMYQLFRFAGRGTAAVFRGEKLTRDVSSGKDKSDFYHRLGID